MSLQVTQILPWTRSKIVSPTSCANSLLKILQYQTEIQISQLHDNCLLISNKVQSGNKGLLVASENDVSVQFFENNLAQAALYGQVSTEIIQSVKERYTWLDTVIIVGDRVDNLNVPGLNIIKVRSDIELALVVNYFSANSRFSVKPSDIKSVMVNKSSSNEERDTFEIHISDPGGNTTSKSISNATKAVTCALDSLRLEKNQAYVVQVCAINGLASIELGIIVSEVLQQMERTTGITSDHVFTTHISNKDQSSYGFGIAIIPVSRTVQTQNGVHEVLSVERTVNGSANHSTSKFPPKAVRIVRSACKRLIENEPEITRLDVIAGDGDCGTTLKAGAEAVLRICSPNGDYQDGDEEDLSELLNSIADALEGSMGGTSGIIFTIFFRTWARKCEEQPKGSLAHSMKESLDTLLSFTPARRGDRTLLDTLIPFVESIDKGDKLAEAVEHAKNGCEKTQNMKPGLGRAIYVPQDGLEGVADAGAVGVLSLIEGALGEI